ncbi:ABC transporter ATP-binding protein [Mycoplasmoides pneumoniae]|uniref:ABC transporter ATP-binding protein n=1 Tax=Mycoplasmoides pneumoniae TaxID=2104 RepID=UPI0033058BF9
MLNVTNLSFTYPRHSQPALKKLNFSLKPNTHVAIIGHNGSGKSTLVKLLGGFLKAPKQTIFFRGQPLEEVGFRQIGILLQDPDMQLLGDTLHQELIFSLENHGVDPKQMDRVIADVLAVVELQGKQFTPLSKLSFGEKQRAVFACLLAVKPELYLLDEAFSMLDGKLASKLKRFIFKVIKEQQKTVINVTHDFNDLFLADEIIFLSKGQLLKQFSPAATYKQLHLFHQHHFTLPFPWLLAHEVADHLHHEMKGPIEELQDVVDWICKHLK